VFQKICVIVALMLDSVTSIDFFIGMYFRRYIGKSMFVADCFECEELFF